MPITQTIIDVLKPRPQCLFTAMAISLTPSRLNLPTHFKVTSIVLLLAMVSPSTAGPDFASAKRLINSLKPNLKYSEICDGKLPSGQIKSACRLKAVPSVGFLVCNQALGEYCHHEIKLEIKNIGKLIIGNVSTVKIDNEVIKEVKCVKSSELTCAGFLEEWIDKTVGWFHRLDTHFKGNTVPALIERIRRKIETPEGRKKTAADLQTIRAFMTAPQRQYHLICDLQGFFLYSGGFLVSDPQDVKKNMGKDKRCDIDPDREPTTRQVLKGLKELIDNLSRG